MRAVALTVVAGLAWHSGDARAQSTDEVRKRALEDMTKPGAIDRAREEVYRRHPELRKAEQAKQEAAIAKEIERAVWRNDGPRISELFSSDAAGWNVRSAANVERYFAALANDRFRHRNDECRIDATKALIGAGINVSAEILVEAVRSGCVAVVEAMVKTAADAVLAAGVSEAATKARHQFDKGLISREQEEKEMEVLKPVVTEAGTRCDRGNKSACDAMKEFLAGAEAGNAKYNELLDEEKKRAEAANDPERLVELGCVTRARIAQRRADLVAEKKVGKVSGFVDAQAMHDAGREIVGLEEALVLVETDYKKRTGKKLPVARCPEVLANLPATED